MDTSHAPADDASPSVAETASSISSSSPSPERWPANPCMDDAEASADRRPCLFSSQADLDSPSNGVCDIRGDGGLVHDSIERMPSQDNRESYEGPRAIEYVINVQHRVEFSASPPDADQGFDSSNAKSMDTYEEQPVEFCRVCHLTADRSPSVGEVMKLGCACKDELALAHRGCAEAWFKIRGAPTCEICGSIALNVLGTEGTDCVDQWNETEANHAVPTRAERCWHNQPLCNTLVVCLLLVLMAAWLFRVTLF